MYSYEEVYNATLEYFGGDELATNVWISKYCLQDNNDNYLEKTPDEMHKRIAGELSRVEKNKFKSPLSTKEIYELLKNFKYIIPQGSVMFGCGNNYKTISLSNCFLLTNPGDSYNQIMDTDKELVNISKRRGGVGIDLSKLRPRNSPTHNAAKSSTGITSWMERYSNSIREVGQNSRRGALILTLSVHHPDILDFITIKNDSTKVTGANISVRLTKEFLDAVEKDEEYELRFPVDELNFPIISRMVSAKEIWNTIIHSAWLRAEPGLLMWHNIEENTPSSCYDEYKPAGLNPCSELILSELDSCRLLLLNLYNFVINPFTEEAYFDYRLFMKYGVIAQRLMDDIVDLESEKIEQIIKKIDNDPEPTKVKAHEKNMWLKIKKNNDNGRRTGTGITALGDTIAALGIKYGSKESIETTEKIYKALKLACYRSSVDMAIELGPFTEFDSEKEKDHPFLNQIKEEDPVLYNDMQKNGRRNVALLTTSPAGSVSLLSQTTSGIEPLYELKPYIRRKKINPHDVNTKCDFIDKNGDKWQNYEVWHPKLKDWTAITGETNIEKSPWFGACANDLDWKSRIKLQAAAQKHCCHGISSTINLPKNTTEETISKLYIEAFKSGCKGITIYRDGCRDGVLVRNETKERPKELPCEIHHITVKNQKYFVLVGMYEEKPYEIFAGKNGVLDSSIKSGIIIKKRKNFYKAIFDNGDELSPITQSMDEMEEVISRLCSGLLRTGASIHFIVQQLEKVGERQSNIHSFATSVARVLKKYIKDGTKEGVKCDCGEELIRYGGCILCPGCGYSKCQL